MIFKNILKKQISSLINIVKYSLYFFEKNEKLDFFKIHTLVIYWNLKFSCMISFVQVTF
jgi:hypothetical protein